MFEELFLQLKNKKKEIKLTSLEEELKRLKSLPINENNKDSLFYDLDKTETKSKTLLQNQELKVNSISKTYQKRKVLDKNQTYQETC